MGKDRGRYKRYYHDQSVNMPKRTLYNHNKASAVISIANSPTTDRIPQRHSTSSLINTPSPADLNQQIESCDPALNSYDFILSNGTTADEDDEEFSQQFNDLFQNPDQTDIFKKREIAAAFLAAFYNGRTSQSSLTDYLKLSNIYSTIKLPTSFDGLRNLIKDDTSELNYEKTWFCGTCQKLIANLNNRFQRSCAICKTRLNMYYHLDIQQQIRSILKKTTSSSLCHKNDTNELIDIRDGALYKRVTSQEGNIFKKNEAFSFSINTDGISFCKKSKLAIWPVYLVINELPLECRYSIDNVILAGNYFKIY